MTCDEFGRVLPELEGGHHKEQQEHLKSCSSCSDLVSDLNAIAQQARLLTDDHEPSPRVWNSIEIALRQEGLIHQPRPQLVPSVARSPRWRFAWVVPITAALVFGAVLLFMHQHLNNQVAQQPSVSPQVIEAAAQSSQASAVLTDEDQLLNVIAARAPTLRAGYESDLRAVNAYIRDAELSARNDPNDQIAQQYLLNAYEQRAMVYEMALERALP
ncbi:MAG TPA: anti-sigma factor [Terriglobales bacterium]|nr:anti-sigma factor [Terriglobales bacterium]